MTTFLASLLVCLLLSSPLEGHPNRQKRNAQVAVNALNAFPSDAKVTFILPDGNRIQNLEYGQYTTAQVHLGAQSKAEAVLLPSNDTATAKVNSAVSSKSDGFLVAEPDVLGTSTLHLTIYVWEHDEIRLATSFFLAVHHAFDQNNVDVIAFSASRLARRQTDSLLRVAKGMSLWQSHSQNMNEGTYEIKIVPTGSVLDVDQFKNAKSLVEPIYFSASNGDRYYAAIIGLTNDADDYAPKVVSVPPLKQINRPDMPVTNVYVVNAIPSVNSATVMFEQFDYPELYFGQTQMGSFYIARGSAVSVTLGEDSYDFQVKESVAYKASECVAILRPKAHDRSAVDQPHLYCDQSNSSIGNDTARLRIYNFFYDHASRIDVVAISLDKHSQNILGAPTYITQSLQFDSMGETTVIANRSYVLKVFDSMSDPQTSTTLVPDLYVNPIGGRTHYIVIYGIEGNSAFPPQVTTYPAEVQPTDIVIAVTAILPSSDEINVTDQSFASDATDATVTDRPTNPHQVNATISVDEAKSNSGFAPLSIRVLPYALAFITIMQTIFA